jgi:CubicO group peptidase (beta-lactamase class C family)
MTSSLARKQGPRFCYKRPRENARRTLYKDGRELAIDATHNIAHLLAQFKLVGLRPLAENWPVPVRVRWSGLLSLVLFAACEYAQDPSWSERTPNFWSLEQRDAGFRAMERIYKTRAVSVGGVFHRFGKGRPLRLAINLDAYMKSQRAAGLIVIHRDAIRLEKYRLGYGPTAHWESFSIAKSITSTLLGAAIQDGFIRSLDDNVAQYVPGLKGSPYDDVSIRQLLTMTSGVKWNEDYLDPNSDAVRLRLHRPEPGLDVTVSYMRQLQRDAPAGERWVYKTGETNLVGELVSQATGKSLSRYLSEKIWKPYGMERAALWELDESGEEMGGCCLSASLRDYARFGQFIVGGARIGGKAIVPPDWLNAATRKQVDIGASGRGYGYQWWTSDDGSFQAIGIFGQSIFIDPKRVLVMVTNGNWPTATDTQTVGPARAQFFRAIQAAVDAESGFTPQQRRAHYAPRPHSGWYRRELQPGLPDQTRMFVIHGLWSSGPRLSQRIAASSGELYVMDFLTATTTPLAHTRGRSKTLRSELGLQGELEPWLRGPRASWIAEAGRHLPRTRRASQRLMTDSGPRISQAGRRRTPYRTNWAADWQGTLARLRLPVATGCRHLAYELRLPERCCHYPRLSA